MKRNFLTFFGLLLAILTFANGPFEKAMSKSIPAVFSASNSEELQNVINQLSRIGAAEGNRWEPYYYAAYGYIRMSGMVEKSDEKDKYLDLAKAEVEKGQAIDQANSELESLKGYAIMIQLTLDPQARGMTYSGMAFESFNKAVQLNPENPRALYLLGRMQYGTAQFMGGGNSEACATLSNAKALFAKEAKTGNPFAPDWGKESTDEAIKQICEGGE